MSKIMLGAAGVCAVAILTACGTSSATTAAPPPPAPASQVAASLHLTGFTDCGAAPVGGVADEGTAYDGGVRIGVDTFATTAARDAWLKMASSVGVTSWQQGPTWIAYRALSQNGKGCA